MNMPKFIHIAVIVTLSLFTLNGCGSNVKKLQQHNTESQKASSVPASFLIPISEFLNIKIDSKRPLRPYFEANSSYGINDKKYTDYNEQTKTNVTIYYPQISGLDQGNNEEKINQILKDTALNDYKGAMETNGLLLERDYMITLSSPDILSVCFAGYYNVQGTAHPGSEFFASTIDIKNAVSLKLGDIVDAEKLFSKDNQAHFKFISDNKAVLDTYTFDELFETYLRYPDDTTHTNDFYLTKDSIGIMIGVPYAAGDYVVLEIPYSSIESILKRPFMNRNE